MIGLRLALILAIALVLLLMSLPVLEVLVGQSAAQRVRIGAVH